MASTVDNRQKENNNHTATLNDFYIREYEKISEAHFQVSHKITTFFQYAILLLSAPLALFGVVNEKAVELIPYVFLCISVVGFFIIMYLTSLRNESLQYARTVNQIRNTLYSMSQSPINDGSIVMLTQKHKPSYFDSAQFIFIVLALGLLESFYFGYAILELLTVFGEWRWIGLFAGILFFLIVLLTYRLQTLYAETGRQYYKQILGVDIDGVLNLHEKNFVRFYNSINNADIKEEDIISIPVYKSGIISEENERKVFQNRDYWNTLEADRQAVEKIKRIQNSLGYKIEVFTWRAWENFVPDINKLTKDWLKNNNIIFDKLKFEKGNYDIPIGTNKSQYRNRFYYAKTHKIKYFIEDEPIKAIKLSQICRYVFLIKHKYNETAKLPYNVILVNDWCEIYEKLKEME